MVTFYLILSVGIIRILAAIIVQKTSMTNHDNKESYISRAKTMIQVVNFVSIILILLAILFAII